MKISAVETIVVALPHRPLGPPTGFGGRPWTTLDVLLVRVDTDLGLTGWGEAFGYNVIPATKAALDHVVAPLCVGRDAADIAGLMLELQQALNFLGRNGPVTFGLSGVDIALWDLAGKAAGLPLHRLLGGGGTAPAEVEAYASLLRYGEPDAVARVASIAAERGYRHIKLHEVTAPPVEAARRALGPDIALMVDCNCPWTVAEAIRMARRLEPCDLFWLEEPVWPPENHAGLAELRLATDIPIAAGENAASPVEFRQLFEAEAVAFAQPSVTKVGGVTEMRKVLALAEPFNVTVAPHSPYFGPGLLATLHLIAAAPRPLIAEWLFCDLEAPFYGDRIGPRDGRLRVPDGPGLGADPDPAVVEKHRTA